MSAGLAALAIGLAAAGVLSVATRDTRSAIVAVAVVAVVSPVLGAGAPEPLALAARLLAALLAAYLLWAAVRGRVSTAGSPIGFRAEAVLALAAGVAAYAGSRGAAVPEAVAAGVALLATGAGPLLTSRDALRMAVGAMLVVHGSWLVRVGLLGAPAAGDELALAALIAALGAGGAALIARARGGTGTLDLGARRAPAAEMAARGDEPARGTAPAGARRRVRIPRGRSPAA